MILVISLSKLTECKKSRKCSFSKVEYCDRTEGKRGFSLWYQIPDSRAVSSQHIHLSQLVSVLCWIRSRRSSRPFCLQLTSAASSEPPSFSSVCLKFYGVPVVWTNHTKGSEGRAKCLFQSLMCSSSFSLCVCVCCSHCLLWNVFD